jgi:hypothetical protein
VIVNPDWIKPKEKPYMHQMSIDCIETLLECLHKFYSHEIDEDTSSKIVEQLLREEIIDPEFLSFAIDNFNEILNYLFDGVVNIRIHRDIEGNIWFGAG